MARSMLRKDDPWISTTEPDVRGWSVKDHDGRPLGRVEDVYVNSESGSVDSIVVASGRVVPAHALQIHRDYLSADIPMADDSPYVEHTEPIQAKTGTPAPGSFEARFLSHFDSAYGDHTSGFADYLPAYQFGRRKAVGARLFGVSFSQAEQHLRALYELRFPSKSYDDSREAVRFGFDMGSDLRATNPLEFLEKGDVPPEYLLDRALYRPSDEESSPRQAMKTGTSMSTSGDAHE